MGPFNETEFDAVFTFGFQNVILVIPDWHMNTCYKFLWLCLKKCKI